MPFESAPSVAASEDEAIVALLHRASLVIAAKSQPDRTSVCAAPCASPRIVLAQKARTPVSVACELLGVSTSGYYAWVSQAPSDRALSDARVVEKIKTIHAENRGVYG